jgi:hypothetical protein
VVTPIVFGLIQRFGDGLANTVDVVQGLVTTAGILVAGVWAFYVFVLGRSFSANVHMTFDLERVIESPTARVAVLAVKAKNIGRTRVHKRSVHIHVVPIAEDELDQPPLALIPGKLNMTRMKRYPIFEDLAALEPDEEVTEDVMLSLGSHSRLKVEVRFVGRVVLGRAFRIFEGGRGDPGWVSRGVLDLTRTGGDGKKEARDVDG